MSMIIDIMNNRSKQFIALLLVFVLIILVIPGLTLGAISCSSSYSPTRNVNMGNFNPYNYTNIVVPVTLTISCTSSGKDNGKTINYVYTFDGGSSTNPNTRRMVLNANYVNYGLCTSSSCTQNYGNGANGTYSITQTYTLSGSKSNTWNLYFVVPVQPLSSPGTYKDTINVSLVLNY